MEKGILLDIGCGSGLFLKTLQSFNLDIIGIDISPRAILLCRELFVGKEKNHHFFQCDICDFDIEDNYYMAVTAMTSLCALKRVQMLQQLQKIKRGLKPGGIIYIEVFTTRDPIYSENDKYLPPGENTFFFPQWNSFLYFFKPGELLHRFKDYEILDYKELFTTDYAPVIHRHHEARLCARKPELK